MSESSWYVTDGEWRMGPLTLDDAVEVVGRRHEPGELLVWREGMDGWVRAEQVPELTEASRTAARQPSRPPSRPAQAPQPPAPDAAPAAPWFLVGTGKLVVMSIATLGLYEIYWFFQQWHHVRLRGERVHAGLRTVFAGIFCYALFRRIADSAQARGVTRVPAPGWLTAAFILLWIAGRLPGVFSLLSFLSVWPLVVTQRAASAVALLEVPTADPNTRLTPINWVGIAAGVLILLLALIGATLPEKPTPAPTTTTRLR